ncbi:hypothetical protein AB6C56_08625 [Vibrio splendidus]
MYDIFNKRNKMRQVLSFANFSRCGFYNGFFVSIIVLLFLIGFLAIENMSNAKFTTLLYIGGISSLVSFNVFIQNFCKELSIELEIINEQISKRVFIDLRHTHATLFGWEVGEKEFVNVISDRYESYRNRLVFSSLLSFFPLLTGIFNYLGSI